MKKLQNLKLKLGNALVKLGMKLGGSVYKPKHAARKDAMLSSPSYWAAKKVYDKRYDDEIIVLDSFRSSMP